MTPLELLAVLTAAAFLAPLAYFAGVFLLTFILCWLDCY